MLISFNSKKEEYFYSCFKCLSKKYGKDMARKIIQRIGQLQAVSNPLSLPKSTRFHEHQGNRKGLFSIDLIHPQRLIIFPTCKYSHFGEMVSFKIYEIFNPHK